MPIQKIKVDYYKLAISLIVAWYFFHFAELDISAGNWNLFDVIVYNANVGIHETGHAIFSFFGEFMHVLGGSFTEVVVPIIFSVFFFIKKQYFSGSILVFWIGQNIIMTAWYMGDAIAQQLPLINEGTNDWTVLLTQTGLLKYTDFLSGSLFRFGLFTIACATILCIFFSFIPRENQIQQQISQ